MKDVLNVKKPQKLYRGQELGINSFDFITGKFMDIPEESFKPRSTFGAGKTVTGKFVGDAVFATDSYDYASLYAIPKVDEFSAGFVGYNINQNFLIISNFAKVYYDNFPEEFGYVYAIENTEPFSPVVVKGKVAEWYAKSEIFPIEATKVKGLDDIAKHNQVLYLAPEITWKNWSLFSLKNRGKPTELYNAIQKGLLISYNQEQNINCVNLKINDENNNIFKRFLTKTLAGKQR